MTTKQQLIDLGYKVFVSKSNMVLKHTDTLYQKLIRNADGDKLYYIDAWYYKEEAHFKEAFQFEVQFYDGVGEAVMNVTLFERDVLKAEAYFATMHKNLGLGFCD
jgi:hypothetical protein